MKFKSQVYTQASGSIGGITYSRAKGGTMYTRSRAIPTDPATSNQTLVRALMSFLVNTWMTGLSAAQRQGWESYAANVPVTNVLGDQVFLSGQNWYVGSNVLRGQAASKLAAGISLASDASVEYNRGDYTAPSAVAYDTTTGLSLAFDNTDDWANEDDAGMLVFQGSPRPLTQNFFKGPFRLVGAIEGDSTTAPTSPFTLTAVELTSRGFTIATNMSVATAIVVVRADGRYTSKTILQSVTST